MVSPEGAIKDKIDEVGGGDRFELQSMKTSRALFEGT